MIKELFQPDLLLIMSNKKPKNYVDFFAAMFERQETFDKDFLDIKYYGKYTPGRSSGIFKTRSFPAVGANWGEFQLWLDTAFALAKPVNLLASLVSSGAMLNADAVTFLGDMGLYSRPVAGGLFSPIIITFMTASDGTLVASGLITDVAWETAYNTILIPYERSIKSTIAPNLRYIKNLNQYGDYPTYYRTSTLKFDGTGV